MPRRSLTYESEPDSGSLYAVTNNEPQRSPAAHLIIKHRDNRKMSQQQLAKETGYSPGYIGFLEMGHRNLSKEAATRIADALNLTGKERDRLLSFVEERQPTITERLDRLEAAVADLVDRVRGDGSTQ